MTKGLAVALGLYLFCGTRWSGGPNYKADLRQDVAYVSCEPTESARGLFGEDCEPIEEEE